MKYESQIILDSTSLIIFQNVARNRIKKYERSISYSIMLSKEKFEKDMRKPGWFSKSFVKAGEEITESHLEEYITKYRYYDRSPSDIKEYVKNKIKYIKNYLVTFESKIIMSLELYNNWMNDDYSNKSYFNCFQNESYL